MTFRVAVFAGTLACGGAEKQLLYQLAALNGAGVRVEVFALSRGEMYESAIRAIGIPVHWVGRLGHPAPRLVATVAAAVRFRPHVVQASHFFMNLYAVAAARASGAVEIGSVRSDGHLDVRSHGRWGQQLLRRPRTLLANSRSGRRNLLSMGLGIDAIHVLPNVIDVAAFDARAGAAPGRAPRPLAIAVGRLDAVKRYERFLEALALARRHVPELQGEIVGDGPARASLESRAHALGLLPNAVTFSGARDDVPARLTRATLLVSCSDHEGFPNVFLEAMAASLPIVTTPAGDCPLLIERGGNGFVVPYDDIPALADRITRLATDATRATRLGAAGRRLVERDYTPEALAPRLLQVYAAAAAAQGRRAAVPVLVRDR